MHTSRLFKFLLNIYLYINYCRCGIVFYFQITSFLVDQVVHEHDELPNNSDFHDFSQPIMCEYSLHSHV